MIKELYCSICGVHCGEMRLGRIRKDTKIICSHCFSELNDNNGLLSLLKIFKGK